MKAPLFIVVDLFCGFGGTTLGYELAELQGSGIAKVFACVNHDPKAIKSHWMNHSDVRHFEEDIRTLDLTELNALTKFMRAQYPHAKLVLWASLECTNFSKAKGGLSRDADSRTLADHLPRYIKAINPDFVKIENVVEFMKWGPMIPKIIKVGRYEACKLVWTKEKVKSKRKKVVVSVDAHMIPDPAHLGEYWIRWCKQIDAMGYSNEWKQINSANLGAYTSRNRFFQVFAKDRSLITWPEPTHAKEPSKKSIHGDLKRWMPVKDVLDFSDEGESILNRDEPLVENTLKRVLKGCIKHVGYSSNTFLMHYYSNGGEHTSIDRPCTTITRVDGKSIVQAEFFIEIQYGSGQLKSIHEPAGTVMPNDKHRLYTSKSAQGYLFNPGWGGHTSSIEQPAPVIVARQDKAPLYYVEMEKGPVKIAVYKSDSPTMIKIKEFMVQHNLVDIKMRMLKVDELLQIQGFPIGYKMAGNQTERKKFIGNSVVPHVVKAWAEAMGRRLIELQKKVA